MHTHWRECNLQDENFHLNLNFAISLMANLLKFTFADYEIFKNFSMMGYITFYDLNFSTTVTESL